MSRRDFRCAFSGVSLLDAEAAAVLLVDDGAHLRPCALPLFGVYEGHGTLGDVSEGPNADLILAWFQKGLAEKRVEVDFATMGLLPQAIDHIETLLSIVACSQIQDSGAVRTNEGPLGFALLSAHVAAALMEVEPALPLFVAVEELPRVVFDSEVGRQIYGPLRDESHRLRCKFGLSMVGLAALDQAMKAGGRPWCLPGPGIELGDAKPAMWLAEALLEFSDSPDLIEAIEDYSQKAEDEL